MHSLIFSLILAYIVGQVLVQPQPIKIIDHRVAHSGFIID